MFEDEAWPLNDILKKLCEATKILLNEKNYDGHGYEEIAHCLSRAEKYLSDRASEVGVGCVVSLPSQNWISVKERLPESGLLVLAMRDCPDPTFKLAFITTGSCSVMDRDGERVSVVDKPMWDVDGLDIYLHIGFFDYWKPLTKY